MSSDLPVPRTAVRLGITDPVERARAELKATLAAIEDKGNIPRRVGRATDRAERKARVFARTNPVATAAVVLAGAAAIGALVWAIVRSYTR